MAIVGDAHVLVRALTDRVRPDIERAFRDAKPTVTRAGSDHGTAYSQGFQRGATGIDDHIEGQLGAVDASGQGMSSGGDWADGFMRSLAAGLDLDAALGRSSASGTGHRVGSEIGRDMADGVEDAVRDIGNVVETELSAAGGRGGRGFASSMRSSGFDPAAKAAADSFTMLWSAGNILGAGLAGLVGGLSSVVSGLFAMGAAAASAVGSLAAVPGVIAAAVQGMAAFKMGFSGITAAIKSGLKANETSTTATSTASTAAANAIASAQRRIIDAQKSTARAVDDAKRSLQRAYRDAAEAAANAAIRVSDAERDVADAQREVLRAQLDLNAAREAGAETLQQLGFSVEDAMLAEERAALRLQDAHAQLIAVQQTPADNSARVRAELLLKEAELGYRVLSARARADAELALMEAGRATDNDRAKVEAELSFKEAELGYRRAKDRAADLKKDQAEASKAGVEGTQEVVSAQERLNNTLERQADAEYRLVKAKQEQDKTAADNAERIADAQLRLSRAQSDGADRIAEAQRALAEAYKQQATAAGGATAAQNAFEQSMSRLSPQAQDFVRYIISIRDEWTKLKQAIGVDMFPKLIQAIDPIVKTVFPLLAVRLRETGSIIGDMALSISNAITSPAGLDALDGALATNNETLSIFAGAMGDVVLLVLRFIEATGPLTQRFATWITGWVETKNAALGTAEGMKSAQDWFEKAGDAAAKVGEIFGGLWETLKILGRGSEEAGNMLLDSFSESIQGLNDFLRAAEEDGSLQAFFTGAAENFKIIAGLLGGMASAFLGVADDPRIGEFFTKLGEAGEPLRSIGDSMLNTAPYLAELVVQAVRLLDVFAESGAAEAFFVTLSESARVLADILQSDLAQKILLFLAPALGVMKAFRLMSIGAQFLGLVLAGNLQSIKLMADRVKNLFSSKAFKGVFGGGGGGGAKPGAASPLPNAASPAQGAAARAAASISVPVKPVINTIDVNKKMGPLSKIFSTIGKVGAGAFKVVGGALRVLMGPIGLIASIAIPLLIGGFKKLYTGNEKFRQFIDKLWNALVGIGSWISDKFMGIIGGLSDWFTSPDGGGKLGAFGSELVGKFKPLIDYLVNDFWPMIQTVFSQVVDAIKPVVAFVVEEVWPRVQEAFGAIVGFLQTYVIPFLTTVLGGAFSFLAGAISVAAGIIAKVVETAFRVISWVVTTILVPLFTNIVMPVFKKFLEFGVFVFDKMKQAWGLLVDALGWAWENIGKPLIDVVVAAFNWLVDGAKIAWDKFSAGWDQLVAGLQWVWDNIGVPLLDGIVLFFTNFWEGLKVIWGWLQDGWDALMDAFKWVWDNIGAPMLDAVVDYFKRTWEGLKVIWGWLQDGWDALMDAFKWVWDNIGKPLLDVIKAAFDHFWNGLKIIWGWIKDGWNGLMDAFKWAWDSIGKPLIDGVKSVWEGLWTKGEDVFNKLKNGWQTFVDKLKDAWDKTGKPVVDGIKGAFENMGDVVSNIWDKIKNAPATGLRNLINNLNNWLVKPLNSLTSKFGLNIPTIPMPQGLADGGRVRGRGGEREDKVPIMGSPNEFMVRAWASKRIGYEALNYINRNGKLPPQGGAGPVIAMPVFSRSAPVPYGGWLGDFIEDPSGTTTRLLAKGAGAAVGALLDSFKGYLPKGDSFVSELIRKIWENLSQSARSWGGKKDSEREKLEGQHNSASIPSNIPYGAWRPPMDTPYRYGPGYGNTYRNGGYHSGQDMNRAHGSAVRAASAGVIASVRTMAGSYGKHITIAHANGIYSLYAHLVRFMAGITAGSRVAGGQIIGFQGSTGNSTGSHLHFEIRKGRNAYGAAINPKAFFRNMGVKLATGGVVQATAGGVQAIIGEGGRDERVEPLDSSGLSRRDRAMIEMLAKRYGAGAGGIVYIGHVSIEVEGLQEMQSVQGLQKVLARVPLTIKQGTTAGRNR